MDFTELKKFFLFSLIGALIVAALVAVVTVLIGKFNETAWRVMYTLFMVIVHSLISLAFIWDDKRQDTFDRLSFFTNVLFVVIVLSFMTSILNIWDIIPGDLVWNLYQTYFVIGFASLHSNILAKALDKEGYLDKIIYLNYVLIVIVVAMLMPIIYLESAFDRLGELYYRILGASAIIDGTLSILSIIFYKLYMNKHPREQNTLGGGQGTKAQKKGLSIWVWILLIYLFLQIVIPILILSIAWGF